MLWFLQYTYQENYQESLRHYYRTVNISFTDQIETVADRYIPESIRVDQLKSRNRDVSICDGSTPLERPSLPYPEPQGGTTRILVDAVIIKRLQHFAECAMLGTTHHKTQLQ